MSSALSEDPLLHNPFMLPSCSFNGTDSLFEGVDTDVFARYLLLVYPIIFLLVGVPADLVSMVIWARRVKDSQGSTPLYLTALCAVDTLVLIQGCLRHLVKTVVCVDYHQAFGCRLPLFAYTWLSTLSVWIICLMCFERLVCVIWPFDMKVVCRVRNGFFSLTGVALLCASTNLYLLIIIGPASNSCDAMEHYKHLRSFFNTLDSVVYSYLPFALIVSLNGVIVIQLSKRRRNLAAQRSGQRSDTFGGNPRRRTSNKIFITVFCMAICHLLFTAPIVVWHIRGGEWCNFEKRPVICARLEFSWQVFEMLNHLTHFFIFSLTSPVFKADLWAMARSLCPRLASWRQTGNQRTVGTVATAGSQCRRQGNVERLEQVQLLPIQQTAACVASGNGEAFEGAADLQHLDNGYV